MRAAFAVILTLFLLSGIGASAEAPEMDSPVAHSIALGMKGRVPAPIEGIWRVPGEGSVLGIRPAGRDKYELVIVDCQSPSILPGTVMGHATSTAKAGVYDADLYTKVADGALKKSADFIIKVSPEGDRFTLTHYFKGKVVRLWRLLPYLFRYSVADKDERPRDIDGCIRIWPETCSPTATVVL